MNPGNDSQGTELVIQETPNNDNRVRIGTTGGAARVGIGRTGMIG